MKKTILIIVSCIMLLSLIVLPSSAESEESNTYKYLLFKETEKAYPLAETVEDSVGFFEYYDTNAVSFTLLPIILGYPYFLETIMIDAMQTSQGLMGGIHNDVYDDEWLDTRFAFNLFESNNEYDDFAFIYSPSPTNHEQEIELSVVAIKNGEKTIIHESIVEDITDGYENFYFRYAHDDLTFNGKEYYSDILNTPDTPTNPDRVYSSGLGLYINPNDIKDYNKQTVYDVPEWTVVPDKLTTEEMTKYGFIGRMFNVGEINANNCVFDFWLYNQDYIQRLRITYSGSNYNIINVTVESDVYDHLGYGSTLLFNSFNSEYDFMIYKYDNESSDFTEYRYCYFDKTTGEVKGVGVNNDTLLFTSILPFNPYYEDNPSDHEDCIGYENGYNEGLQHANKLEYDKGYAQGVADTKDGIHDGDYKYTEEDLKRYYDIGYLAGQDTNGIVNDGISGFFSALGGFFEPFMTIGIGNLTVYSLLGLMIIACVVVVIIKIAKG